MSRKPVGFGAKGADGRLRVELISCTASKVLDPSRLQEIADIVVQIILLSHQRGRAGRRAEEKQNAA